MGAILFSHFRVTNVKLINEKKVGTYYSFKMTWTMSFYYVFFVFSLLCCKYVCDIFLSMLEFNGLRKFSKIFIYKKISSSCEPKEERPHAGL